MPLPLIDTHAHLDDDRFSTDLPAVLDRATAAGVTHTLTIGIDLPTSRAAVALAGRFPQLRAVVGIQPNHVSEAGPTDWDEIMLLAETAPSVVAVGESGLDRYWDRAPFDLQEDYFARHLQLARRLAKPIVIHCREAEADVVRMLRSFGGPIAGVMHSFSGDAATATACLELGLHVSFAGMVTYKNADALREVVKVVPLDRLLVETDSPYLAPVPVRGKRNEPAFVRHTAECVAKAKGVSTDELCDATTRNAKALFGILGNAEG
ncbi:MAG: TatD family hydrolase [Fimbriiglobus sp.]|jgi:TatD DNase family protein|nr:TatD family hydrolase [Fimbriiglobus sp.]